MKAVKRGLPDFICAFVIVMTVAFCVAMLTNAGFFEDALVYDESKTALELFGISVKLDERAVFVLDKLLSFNDVFFGRGFSAAVRGAGECVFNYISDVLTVVFALARRLAGAEQSPFG